MSKRNLTYFKFLGRIWIYCMESGGCNDVDAIFFEKHPKWMQTTLVYCTVYTCLCNRIIVHVFNLLDTKPFIETRFTCSFHLYVLLQLNNHAFWSVSVAISLCTGTQRCNGCYGIAVWYNSLQIANFLFLSNSKRVRYFVPYTSQSQSA